MGLNVGKFQKTIIFGICVLPILLASSNQQFRGVKPNSVNSQTLLKKEIASTELNILNLSEEIKLLEEKSRSIHHIVDLVDGRSKLDIADTDSIYDVLQELQFEREKVFSQYQAIVFDEYKNRSYQSKLYFLASANSIKQLVNRITHLRKLKRLRKNQLRSIDLKNDATQSKLVLITGSDSAKEELSKRKIEELHKLYIQLKDDHLKLAALKENNKRMQLLLEMIVQDKTNKLVEGREDLNWPISIGVVSSEYGEYKHEKERKVLLKNNGIDFILPVNGEILAVDSGEVKAIFQLPNKMYGVIVKHKGYRAVYTNVVDPIVVENQKVNSHDIIGIQTSLVDDISRFHFEIWKNNKTLDPKAFLKELN